MPYWLTMDFAVLAGPQRRAKTILKRSAIINGLLALAIGLVGLKIYEIWQQDDWRPIKQRDAQLPVTELTLGRRQGELPLKTDLIVERNLFDASRGSGGSGRAETASTNDSAVAGLTLLGTIVTDGEQFAIIKVPPEAAVGGSRGAGAAMRRLAIGDSVWGYELVEIQAQRVILKKGASEVELGMDFTRNHITVQPPKAKVPQSIRRKKAARK